MSRTKYRLLVLSLICNAVVASAQSVRFFSSDNSLSSSLVSVVYEDSVGYVWIGTENGLNRFDGAQMKVFMHDHSRSTSLLHNRVQAINNDDKGHLLVGTKIGLQWFDYGTNEFHDIPFPEARTGVRNIFSHNGHTYLSTGRLGILDLTWTKDGLPRVVRVRQFQLSSAQQSIVDDTGTLWVVADDGSLHFLSGKAKRDVKIKSTESFTSLFLDRHGMLLAGTHNHGVFRYNRASRTFRPFATDITTPVKEFRYVDADNVYIATDGEGVKLMNVNTGELQDRFLNLPAFDMKQGKISSLFINQRGDTWIATYRYGVFFSPRHIYGFHTILPVIPKSGRSAGYVSTVCGDNSGGLWIATDYGGLFHYDASGQMLANYSYTDGLPHGVMSLFVDSKGRLWIGSYVGELCYLDPTHRRFIPLSAITHGVATIIDQVHAIAEDHHGKLWIGTQNKGLFYLDQ